MTVHCYSRRLLQPFRGTSQTLAVPGGEAESMDGFEWILYVMDDRIVTHTGLSEVRYGNWNPEDGLTRSKVRGTAPARLIEEVGYRLVAELEARADQVPFPSRDRFECWLLAAGDRRPLVLIDSAVDPTDRGPVDRPEWMPGAAARSQFQPGKDGARRLVELVGTAAGKRAAALWLERQPDGAGVTHEGERLRSELFPCLLFREDWADPIAEDLVQDYLAWQAPWLLQLPNLDPATRRRLEVAAWRRPLEVARSWRLFPGLFDPEGLRVARVKAMILVGGAREEPPPEPFYPFVNE